MRGLKHFRYSEIEEPFSVAPHVGAWIETFFVETCRTYKQVAPHVGACVSLNTILTLLKHHLNAILIA